MFQHVPYGCCARHGKTTKDSAESISVFASSCIQKPLASISEKDHVSVVCSQTRCCPKRTWLPFRWNAFEYLDLMTYINSHANVCLRYKVDVKVDVLPNFSVTQVFY